jgi:hypothetical protein
MHATLARRARRCVDARALAGVSDETCVVSFRDTRCSWRAAMRTGAFERIDDTRSDTRSPDAAGLYELAGQLAWALGLALRGALQAAHEDGLVARGTAEPIAALWSLRAIVWIELAGTALFIPVALRLDRGARTIRARALATRPGSVQRFDRRRTATIERGPVHQAVLLDELEIFGTCDQAVGAAIHQALAHAAVGVAEAARPWWLGDDPDLAPMVLDRDPPGPIVAAHDARLAKQ